MKITGLVEEKNSGILGVISPKPDVFYYYIKTLFYYFSIITLTPMHLKKLYSKCHLLSLYHSLTTCEKGLLMWHETEELLVQYMAFTSVYVPWPRYEATSTQLLTVLTVLLRMTMTTKGLSSPLRTHTPMRTNCWRRLSSWLRLESATRRKSTRQPDTWRSGSRTLSGESNTGSCCSTCLSPSTHTPRRWDSMTQKDSKRNIFSDILLLPAGFTQINP